MNYKTAGLYPANHPVGNPAKNAKLLHCNGIVRFMRTTTLSPSTNRRSRYSTVFTCVKEGLCGALASLRPLVKNTDSEGLYPADHPFGAPAALSTREAAV